MAGKSYSHGFRTKTLRGATDGASAYPGRGVFGVNGAENLPIPRKRRYGARTVVGGSVTRLGCVIALALAALAGPSLARADGGLTPGQHQGTRGTFPIGGAHPVKPMAAAATPSSQSGAGSDADIPGPLSYHGGAVFGTQNIVHAIYWFPSGYPLSASWRSSVDGWLGNVADDSGTTSNVFADTEQYNVPYDATFAGSAVDTDAFPSSGCGDGIEGGLCLTEAQIDAELVAFAHSQGWSGDTDRAHPTHLFIVYLPKGVADCFDNAQGICSANSDKPYYCAYHTDVVSGSETFVWANMPWSWDVNGCGVTSFPNGALADTAISVTSHEYVESITDPYLNAWYDSGGYEVADKCQSTFGESVDPKQTGYNQLIHGGHYWMQLEYSNELGDCFQTGDPVISSFSPANAAPGGTVHIAGENFFGALTVKFDGIQATVSARTPTALTVRVPAGNVYGRITVRGTGGTGVSATNFGFGGIISALSPLDGQTGTTVTIAGSGMSEVTSVKFGGIAAAFDVVDDGTITAQVPAGFSSGKVTIGNTGGTATSSQGFQVTKVTSLVTPTGKAGSIVTIGGQGLASATTVDFPGHSGGVPVLSATASTIRVVVPNDATYGPLTVHTPNIDAAGIATKVFKATPTIATFTPDGKAGTTLTITGANLGDATAVKFGPILGANLDVVDATTVEVDVPAGFSMATISVVTPHGTAVAKAGFYITTVTGFTPLSAAAGATITISGQGLKSATTVDFPGASGVAVLATTTTTITVKLPAGASTGTLTIHTPNIDGAGITTAKALKPLPRIASFDAASYQAGDLVTAHGSNLVETGAYSAKLGTVAVPVNVVDAQTLTFTLPANASTNYLTFTNAAGSTTTTVRVKVRPTIAGFTPGDLTTGKKVTLTGATFNGTTSVSFGGVATTAFTVGAGATSLVVTVPAGAIDGPIAVTNAGGTTASADTFVVDPHLVGFSPASGAVGTTVTVTGTGLKHVTRVDFGGGVSATPVSTSAASLKVVVPPGATSGPIAVHASAADSSAGTSFTVTFSVTSFSQPYAAPGATITIDGVGLTGITAVKFGTLTASISSQSGTSMTVVVPAITGSSAVSVTKGATTIAAPSQFGLFAVTSASPAALAPGGTLTVDGSSLDDATATFAGVADPVALADDGTATVPDGFTGGTVTIADPYGDAIDETIALFAISAYSASHAGPGDSIDISIADGRDYSSSTVHVKFAGASAVTGVGGSGGKVTVTVPAGATTGAIQVEAGDSGWATGGAFTVDRATVQFSRVEPGQIQLVATGAGGTGDTTVTWRQGGTTHTIALDAVDVQEGDVITLAAAVTLGELTLEVGTPLGPEDGLALNDGGTPSPGFESDVAALQADGVWGSSDSFDWSTLADGQYVGRTGDATPDDVGNWAIAG